MDVALSLATGLGLRLCLIRVTSPSESVGPAVLGLWEGVLVHQLSFHPPPSASSSPLDHYLALGLRLAVDLLLARNWSRMIMVALWAAIGTILSESISPSSSDLPTPDVYVSSSRREREKLRRRTRSPLSQVPSHIRVYQEPEAEESPPPLPTRAPGPRTSTPTQSTLQINTHIGQSGVQTLVSPNFNPPTPPSFFLHAETEPSPFPGSPTSPPQANTTFITSQVPDRPPSALAFHTGRKPTPPEPVPDPLRSPHLLTPPDSTFRERTMDSRVDRLSTIEEITSRSEHVSEDIEQGEVEGEENYILVSHSGGIPLPIPNATSQYVRAEETPIASIPPSIAPSAIPLPVPPFPYLSGPPSDASDKLTTPGRPPFQVGAESEHDELRTPPVPPVRKSQDTTTPSTPAPDHDQESIQVPGTTLSNFAILQSPVPLPLGPLLDTLYSQRADAELETHDPLTIASDGESVLSTGNPIRLREHAENYRKQALEQGKELERLKSELAKARSQKRARDALFLRGDILKAEERMKKLNYKAERRYLKGNNSLQKPDTLDVHGLKPEEAVKRTEERFRELLRDGRPTLKVITGKGLHSRNGVPVVKNHIMEVMRRQHIPCKEDSSNAGILILSLSPDVDHPLADPS